MRLAALALLLSGCGSGAAVELANRAGYGEARLESHILEKYEAAHPGLRVVQRHPASDPARYRDRLLAAVRAGTPSDAFLIDAADVPTLVDSGALLDLTPFLARVGVVVEDYDSTVLDAFRRGRAVYALPRGYTPLVVAYNQDLFARAGLERPGDDWTWDEFLAAAKQLTRDTDGDGRVDQWGTFFDRRVSVWLAWLWSGGGDVLCADGRHASGCLDSPTTVAAIRWYTNWVTRDSIAPAGDPGRAWRSSFDAFYSGKVAMLAVSHARVPAMRRWTSAGGPHVGFVALPHRPDFPPATVLIASGYAVPALGPRRKLAVELVAALTDSFAGRMRGEAGLELPAMPSVAGQLAARDTLGWEATFLRAAEHGRLPWSARIGGWEAIEAALPDLLDRIVVGGDDADAVARDMARRLDRLLGTAR